MLLLDRYNIQMKKKKKKHHFSVDYFISLFYLGPVHTNPFSNENGAVLLSFQKGLRPHLSFSYRFCPSTPQRRIYLKTLLNPQCAWLNELDASAFQYIGPQNCREIEATW